MQLTGLLLLTAASSVVAVPAYDAGILEQTYPNANVNEDLIGVGGRIYITNVTMAGQKFAMVIDTGSSDTWLATTNFQCLDPDYGTPLSNTYCAFPSYYNRAGSSTWRSINADFNVTYAGGEFLNGKLGTENLGIGGISRGQSPFVTVKQTIGAVDSGYWNGDGISSGLMGLAYPALAKGINNRQLNYTSILYTLLALRRPTTAQPRAGGLLAIGGIPSSITNDGRWVQVPVQPLVQGIYAYYSITVDGYDITPPTASGTPTSSRAPTATPTGRYASSKQNMIIDSGTSLLYFPDEIASYIASLFDPPARYISSTNTYVVLCTARAPRVGVRIGGQSYFISEADLMNKGPGAVGGSYVGAGTGECAVAIQNAMGGTLVLGDAWLKNVVVVFDLANATDIGVGGSDAKKNGGGAVRIVGREVYT
ncbi:hypothetical protein SNOG_12482 [Parastagonospora nodorum SN15]|uniref:Peptidase A1 domain-containing protein n=1 Tax=Phaeosphaeria nodorum (strain SN15 / ATCC MYA-4574 / FGSC 10173) TaxID=321614 RepID=Q0U6Y2_PHANO|nr:hypothetical protein SNOG_12482 [Parastagonospora nodorum SN15]EAT80295.2 hypothetical protein SNOG_12482 [Parastagonospora nodorum SN15]